jgi:hypothetical protein
MSKNQSTITTHTQLIFLLFCAEKMASYIAHMGGKQQH